jgi:hypothetical protein
VPSELPESLAAVAQAVGVMSEPDELGSAVAAAVLRVLAARGYGLVHLNDKPTRLVYSTAARRIKEITDRLAGA